MEIRYPSSTKDFLAWALKNYELESLWDFIRMFHTPDLGYHNLDHLQKVAAVATWLALRQNLPAPMVRLACISGLVHDFGHSGDLAVSDLANVTASLNHFEHMLKGGVVQVPQQLNGIVELAIRSTVYDRKNRVFPNEPQGPISRILRDADVWLPNTPDLPNVRVLSGLRFELKMTETPWDEFLVANSEFYRGITWYTMDGQAHATQIQEFHAQLLESVLVSKL